jgi:hypothetical protein
MTTVRIAHIEPRPDKVPCGRKNGGGWLIILADDQGHRALPLWLAGAPGSLQELADRARDIVTPGTPEELAARLLGAVGASVTGVAVGLAAADAAELTEHAVTTRIELDGPAGARQVPARLGVGLALAAAAGAPVQVADSVMDRLAVPAAGDDLLSPFLDLAPPASLQQPGGRAQMPGAELASLPARRPRFEPRNLAFADGLDRWDLDGSFLREDGGPTRQDYAAAADSGSAVLRSAVPDPRWSAALVQTIFADDYQGAAVVFRAEIRAEDVTDQAGLRLEIIRRGNWSVREDHSITVAGSNDWTGHEVRAVIPEDASAIRFGIGLTGTGLVALRGPELTRGA